MPLRIAAKVDRADQRYYEREIAPATSTADSSITIGEVDDAAKASSSAARSALLFPIDWPEPFGLVMIEAMACGTPVIAFRAARFPR